MRRLILASLAAVTALSVAAAPAMAAMNSKQGLRASVSPSKAGTSKKPANIKLTVNPFVTLDASDAAFATTKAIVYLDKNLVFNLTKFKACSSSKVLANEKSCASGSKVGSGSAQGKALGITENLTITAFNAGSKGLNLLVVGAAPLTIRSVLEGKLQGASGKYGKKLVVDIPPDLQQPAPGAFATLTDFKVVISGKAKIKGKTTSYVQLKGCPSDKKLNFSGDFTFTNGEQQSAATTVACTR